MLQTTTLSSPLAGMLETLLHPFFGKWQVSSEERGEKNLAHICEEQKMPLSQPNVPLIIQDVITQLTI